MYKLAILGLLLIPVNAWAINSATIAAWSTIGFNLDKIILAGRHPKVAGDKLKKLVTKAPKVKELPLPKEAPSVP